MNTSVNTEEVSLHPAQEAGWGVKARAEHGGGSDKHGFGVAKLLAKPSDGRTIAKMTRKNQFNAVNDRLDGKSRLIGLPIDTHFKSHPAGGPLRIFRAMQFQESNVIPTADLIHL